MINKESPKANPFLIFAIVMVFMYIVYYFYFYGTTTL